MEFCRQEQRRESATARAREPPSPDARKRRPKQEPNRSGDSSNTEAPLAHPEQQEQYQYYPANGPAIATNNPDGIVPPSHAHAGDERTSSDEQLPPEISGCGRNATTATSDNADDTHLTKNAVRVASSDGRVACTNCDRWFSSDRVDVHEDICVRVNAAAAARRDEKTSRGRECTTKKKVTSAFSPGRFCRRRSSCHVFRGSNALTRARGERGRSLGRERRWERNCNAINDIGACGVRINQISTLVLLLLDRLRA